VSDIINDIPDWDSLTDAGIGLVSTTVQGESPFRAIDELRDRFGKHFRLGTLTGGKNILEFGEFGEASGVRLVSQRGVVQAAAAASPEIAYVTRISEVEETNQVFNSVIPLGSGHEVNQLTIRKASAAAGDEDIQTGTNKDGSPFYFIQDSVSIRRLNPDADLSDLNDKGRRWKVLPFTQISPISSSDADVIRAASYLKIAGESFMKRHLVPRVTYSLDVSALRKEVKPGDTVRLDYQGSSDNHTYINVKEDFFVMDITYDWNANGQKSANMVISSVAVRRTSDTDIVLGVMNDLNALNMHAPISHSLAKEKFNGLRLDSATEAEVTVRIRSEVTSMSNATLFFKSTPLKSSVLAAKSGGGATSSGGGNHRHQMFHFGTPPGGAPSSKIYECTGVSGSERFGVTLPTNAGVADLYTFSSSGNHSHTVPNHTHDMTYGIFEDTVYPQSIKVSIDGVDRTAALGGPWGQSDEAADVEVDITEYLTEPTTVLQQDHEIIFSCDSSQGQIDGGVDMLLGIQAISIQ
ncbi:MAG: hypothetical protein KAS32_18380, partial [Candidatus Peribacteraceae bacterium]|nr:hypothetical protein [Candidatus Peribacteraceae bacterium]